ncbi:hypothetical protein P256_01346 [Acinetobacter nectaris CIP 110549]|uniref:DUF4124 domain-containing protein n=1 Tax=Acinetobacter nectaris CIP 110549 TaxID=1392540 RepID=V2UWF3_9GAMM|nr:DUF4124 domain-containing protein [Acinetobacter nectaris]ESK39664.1 hypothetical protein P256_01346 [Acinetobacter nectaris CIP 110549]
MLLALKKISLLVLIPLSISSIAYAQDFYKWTDSTGSTHYTTTPPPKQKGIAAHGLVKTYNSPLNGNGATGSTTSSNESNFPQSPSNSNVMPMTQPIPQNDEPQYVPDPQK